MPGVWLQADTGRLRYGCNCQVRFASAKRYDRLSTAAFFRGMWGRVKLTASRRSA